MNWQQVAIPYHTIDLILKFIGGDINEEEMCDLRNWIDADEDNAAVFRELADPQQLAPELATFYSRNPEEAWLRFFEQL